MEHDPNWKTIHEIIYYFPDRRPAAPTTLVAEGFILDFEKGDRASLASEEGDDVLIFKETRKDLPPVEVTITIPRGGYLYRMTRVYDRKRTKEEPPPGT